MDDNLLRCLSYGRQPTTDDNRARTTTEDGRQPKTNQLLRWLRSQKEEEHKQRSTARNRTKMKRKQIPYQTSTQTLKVGRYPAHTKGINAIVDPNSAKQIKKQGTIANILYLDTNNIVTEKSSGIRAKTEKGKKGGKGVVANGKPQPQGNKDKNGQSTRYQGFETRTTPNTLTDAVKCLTEQQKIAVGSMGLDGMLNLGITYVPTQLASWLLESFDSKECKLVTPSGNAEIKPMDVNFTLGLPMGGRPIIVPQRTKPDCILVKKFREQYGDKSENKIKCRLVSEKIQKSKVADDLFKLNFLVLFYSTIVDSTASGKANQRILNGIEGIDDIRALNWGEFIIDRLRQTKDEWEVNKGSPYTGPMPFLMVLYLDRFQDRLFKFERKFPAIIAINDDVIEKRIKSENKQGGFGKYVTLLERNAPPVIATMLEGLSGMAQEQVEYEERQQESQPKEQKKKMKRAALKKLVFNAVIICSNAVNICSNAVIICNTAVIICNTAVIISMLSLSVAMLSLSVAMLSLSVAMLSLSVAMLSLSVAMLSLSGLLRAQENAMDELVAAIKKYDESYQAALKSPNFKERVKMNHDKIIREMSIYNNSEDYSANKLGTEQGEKSSPTNVTPVTRVMDSEMDKQDYPFNMTSSDFIAKHASIGLTPDEPSVTEDDQNHFQLPKLPLLDINDETDLPPMVLEEAIRVCDEVSEKLLYKTPTPRPAKVKRTRRELAPAPHLKSPFISRVITITVPAKQAYCNLCRWLYDGNAKDCGMLFERGTDAADAKDFKTMNLDEWLSSVIIDLWALMLNDNERLKSSESILRFFASTQVTMHTSKKEWKGKDSRAATFEKVLESELQKFRKVNVHEVTLVSLRIQPFID
ncbi:hypothetical protein QQ045_001978 [Rhodiola kirilowii]